MSGAHVNTQCDVEYCMRSIIANYVSNRSGVTTVSVTGHKYIKINGSHPLCATNCL